MTRTGRSESNCIVYRALLWVEPKLYTCEASGALAVSPSAPKKAKWKVEKVF